MHSIPDDRSKPAIIRDAALGLFAEFGPETATIQQIAKAAKVSPGLVIHHFGSKDGLRIAVDEYVATVFDALFDTLDTGSTSTSDLGRSYAEALLAQLPPHSPIPAYLRRLWLSGSDTGRKLFGRWYQASLVWMEQLETQGIIRPSSDPQVRAALLMVNDLSALLFRDHLAEVLKIDLLTGDGMRRWATEAVDLFQGGLFAEGKQS